MAATISFDNQLDAVISIAGEQVTRDSMSESIRRITAELAANRSERLLVDMSQSEITVPVESTTIILDRLLNAVHSHLTVAMIFNDRQHAYARHVADYLSAGMVDIETFSTVQAATAWMVGESGLSRQA
tara:strand:- start:1242 stop:1628 length:387 start_codon:yes stop_codon:yes gene_type:complete